MVLFVRMGRARLTLNKPNKSSRPPANPSQGTDNALHGTAKGRARGARDSEILQANVELSKLAQEYFHRIYTVGSDGSCCRRPDLILCDAVFGVPNLRRHADYQDFLRKFGPITLDDDESLAIELFKRLNQP